MSHLFQIITSMKKPLKVSNFTMKKKKKKANNQKYFEATKGYKLSIYNNLHKRHSLDEMKSGGNMINMDSSNQCIEKYEF